MQPIYRQLQCSTVVFWVCIIHHLRSAAWLGSILTHLLGLYTAVAGISAEGQMYEEVMGQTADLLDLQVI